jgi:tRNA (guanosine-2'-O-)-methyltransferase
VEAPPAGPPPAAAVPPADDPIPPARRARVEAALAHRLESVVVVAEAIYRRHNTSAILRSAEAFGVHEVHLVTDAFRAARGAARGAERWVDVHLADDVDACLDALVARGFRVVVADLAADAHTPDSLPVDRPLAIVFGAELSGVSARARARADAAVMVPMRGMTESLNVSAAAAVVLHRVTERRRALVGPGDLDSARRAAFLAAWEAEEREARAGQAARAAAPEAAWLPAPGDDELARPEPDGAAAAGGAADATD